MAWLFSGLDGLVQGQFDTNEIASSHLVGKVVGSLFTRQTEAAIFEALGRRYGIHVEALPSWLRDVSFERSGTVSRDNMRKIHAENTLIDISMDTVEGLATFLVLILRYVEPPRNILGYIEDLLQGHLYIISGKSLGANKSKIPRGVVLPSVRNVLRSFVNSILDADVDSPQHTCCLKMISHLWKVDENSKSLDALTRHPLGCSRQLLSRLLGNGGCGKTGGMFHTFSIGSAMIVLAALANVADVWVDVANASFWHSKQRLFYIKFINTKVTD
ncbi:MAG: hypothetical protein Q9187_003437 [Circinaria calcarea]